MSEVAALDDWRPTQPRPVTPSTILANELDAVCSALESFGIDEDLLARLGRARDLAAGLDVYLGQCTTPESPALAALARRTHETDWDAPRAGGGTVPLEQEMLSGHVEGQLLKFLVHLADARRVLEIGMFTGYSALAMAEALPADGALVACEIDPMVAEIARGCFDASPDGHKITVEVGPALATLQRLADEDRSAAAPFDFVFIDADKAGYLDYVEYLLEGSLLAPRAIIAIDNTLMQGQPYLDGVDMPPNGVAIAKFNAALTYDARVEQVLIPLRDGLTLIRRTPQAAPSSPQ